MEFAIGYGSRCNLDLADVIQQQVTRISQKLALLNASAAALCALQLWAPSCEPTATAILSLVSDEK
jgi:hypothetical protein